MPRGVRSRTSYLRGSGPCSSQPSLLSPTLDEMLGSDHFVRQLLPLVEEVLGCELRTLCNDRGGYRHDPVAMFSVWMYGLLQGEATSRKLEEKCRYDTRYAFLCSGTTPDHTTLSRFRDSLSDVLDGLLFRLSKEAQKRGLLGNRPLALDGTKVPAVSTQWGKALDRSKEADAAFLTRPNGERLFGYNVQAMTDLQTGYAAGYAVTSHATDFPGVEPALDALESQASIQASSIVADKGYDGAQVYDAVESRGMSPVIAQCRKKPTTLVPQEDGTLRCPAGHTAILRQGVQRGKPVQVYQVSRCAGCSMKTTCGVSLRQKKVVLPDPVTLQKRLAWKAKAKSKEGKALLKARGSSIERLFGSLKQAMGLRRFKLRHTKGARLEFGLGVLAYNLRMILKQLFELYLALLKLSYMSYCRKLQ